MCWYGPLQSHSEMRQKNFLSKLGRGTYLPTSCDRFYFWQPLDGWSSKRISKYLWQLSGSMNFYRCLLAFLGILYGNVPAWHLCMYQCYVLSSLDSVCSVLRLPGSNSRLLLNEATLHWCSTGMVCHSLYFASNRDTVPEKMVHNLTIILIGGTGLSEIISTLMSSRKEMWMSVLCNPLNSTYQVLK